MSNRVTGGAILTPGGFVRGHVEIAGTRVVGVHGTVLPDGAVPEPPFVLPGFIDLHVHGGDGADCMEGDAALRRMLRYHARHGTVAMAPTTITAGADAIGAALTDIAAAMRAPGPAEAIVLGAHLEGPFINPGKLGAQPPLAIPGDTALVETWAATCFLAVATVAPEIPGGVEVVRALARHGCRVQIGHSLADDAACAAAGCVGYTHLFNAMSGMHHRDQGVAGYALAHAEHAEVICDLHHVGATAFLAARRAIPRLYAVTDATGPAGLADGEHRFAGRLVIKREGRIVMRDGTLAGSTITMADALRNLVRIGIPLAEASAMTATRQADYLGLADLGRIAPGARACLVRLDAALRVEAVWIDGESVAPAR